MTTGLTLQHLYTQQYSTVSGGTPNHQNGSNQSSHTNGSSTNGMQPAMTNLSNGGVISGMNANAKQLSKNDYVPDPLPFNYSELTNEDIDNKAMMGFTNAIMGDDRYGRRFQDNKPPTLRYGAIMSGMQQQQVYADMSYGHSSGSTNPNAHHMQHQQHRDVLRHDKGQQLMHPSMSHIQQSHHQHPNSSSYFSQNTYESDRVQNPSFDMQSQIVNGGPSQHQTSTNQTSHTLFQNQHQHHGHHSPYTNTMTHHHPMHASTTPAASHTYSTILAHQPTSYSTEVNSKKELAPPSANNTANPYHDNYLDPIVRVSNPASTQNSTSSITTVTSTSTSTSTTSAVSSLNSTTSTTQTQEAVIKIKTTLKNKYWRNGRRNLQCFPNCKVFGDYSHIKIEDLKQHDFMWGKCRGSLIAEVSLNSNATFDDILLLARVHSLENIPVPFEEAVIRECMIGRVVEPDTMDMMKDHWISGERLPDFINQHSNIACYEFKPKVWKYTDDMVHGKCKRRNVRYYVQFEAFVPVLSGDRRCYVCIGSGMSESFEVGSSRVLARQKRKQLNGQEHELDENELAPSSGPEHLQLMHSTNNAMGMNMNGGEAKDYMHHSMELNQAQYTPHQHNSMLGLGPTHMSNTGTSTNSTTNDNDRLMMYENTSQLSSYHFEEDTRPLKLSKQHYNSGI